METHRQQYDLERRSSLGGATIAVRRSSKPNITITATNNASGISSVTPLATILDLPSPPPVHRPGTPPLSSSHLPSSLDSRLHHSHHSHNQQPFWRNNNTALLWTVALIGCFALAGCLQVLPPLFSQGVESDSNWHLRRHTSSAQSGGIVSVAERQLHLFGDDDRQPVGDVSQLPYSAIGLVRWADTTSCTASLVGERFIVTAAECALDTDGNVRPSTFSKPQFLPAATVQSAATATATSDFANVIKVHRQSEYWKKWTQNRYVLLELDAPIGKRTGVLQLPTLADFDQASATIGVQLAGYDDNAVQSLAAAAMQFVMCACSFGTNADDPLYVLQHGCDTSAVGSPGSPLLVRVDVADATKPTFLIVGIHANGISMNAKTADTAAQPNSGILGPFIQKHLQALEALAAASPHDSAMTTGGGATDADNVGVHSSSENEETEGSSGLRITPTAAVVCIAFVCIAWASILFIAVRHVRRNNGNNSNTSGEATGGSSGVGDSDSTLRVDLVE